MTNSAGNHRSATYKKIQEFIRVHLNPHGLEKSIANHYIVTVTALRHSALPENAADWSFCRHVEVRRTYIHGPQKQQYTSQSLSGTEIVLGNCHVVSWVNEMAAHM